MRAVQRTVFLGCALIVAATALCAQAPDSTSPVESTGPFRYACQDGTKFEVSFFNDSAEHWARFRVNGQPEEILKNKPPSRTYRNDHWTYVEWHGVVTLIDLTQKRKVEKRCPEVVNPSKR